MANLQQSGFAFPMIAKGPLGRVNYTRSNTVALVAYSVQQIILTVPGERMWNPEFGCRVKTIIFEPLTNTLAETVQSLIMEALRRWEPRVRVKASDITVVASQDINTRVTINISYTILNPDFTTQVKQSVAIKF
jgi:phage baseplate assembly protein W